MYGGFFFSSWQIQIQIERACKLEILQHVKEDRICLVVLLRVSTIEACESKIVFSLWHFLQYVYEHVDLSTCKYVRFSSTAKCRVLCRHMMSIGKISALFMVAPWACGNWQSKSRHKQTQVGGNDSKFREVNRYYCLVSVSITILG